MAEINRTLIARAPRRRDSPRRILYGLLALLLVVLAPDPAAGQATARIPEPRSPAHAEAVEQASERVREWLAENNLPGASVAVGLDGELVWAEGFGWADLEQRVPVTPLTRFRIGSVSKPLTAAAVALLYERGRLDLDAPVQEYVPSFPEKRWPISTRQLLGHIAGIRHYRGDEEMLSSEQYDGVLEELEIFAADSLLFRPGTDYSYSSYGFNLASAVVEAAAGEPFLDFMRREVFAPIGMRHTVPDDVFRIVPHRASFYGRDSEGRLWNASYVDQSNKWASGGFLSTPSDLVIFGFAMLEAELLEPETIDLLWTPLRLESGESTEYGLGWFIREIGGRPVIGHGGSSIGGTTAFFIFPDQRMVVAVNSNVTGGPVAPIAMALARLFDPARDSEPSSR
ncbi:MAG: serine hydrolase domain-containing protein [Gemmatimonadota bacterium]